jgi:RNA polymerase sigma factor (TIGR02999 family)
VGAFADAADPTELYRELRRMARARLRDGGRNTLLDTAALVHEAYLRMAPSGHAIADRRQWLAYASRTMRSVVVDMARQRQTERHGGQLNFVTWTEALDHRGEAGVDEVLAIDAALAELERLSPRLGAIVEMRYFAGLDDTQIAAALQLSERSVRRELDKARRLLAQAMKA